MIKPTGDDICTSFGDHFVFCPKRYNDTRGIVVFKQILGMRREKQKTFFLLKYNADSGAT